MNSTKLYGNYLNLIEHDKSMNRKQIIIKRYTNVSALILVLVELKTYIFHNRPLSTFLSKLLYYEIINNIGKHFKIKPDIYTDGKTNYLL